MTATPMDWWWQRVPRAAGRFSPTAHMVLTDGGYVRAFPRGEWAPLASLVVGLVLGARPWEDAHATFSYSVLTSALLIAIGILGGSLGVAAWLGWCLGDALVASKGAFTTYSTTGQLITYLVLGVAMVAVPLVAQGFRGRAEGFAARANPELAPWLGWVGFAVTAAIGIYVWELSVPQLIRPLWVFENISPELPAMEPFQSDVGLTGSFQGLGFFDGLQKSSLVVVTVLASIARAVATSVAGSRNPVAVRAEPLPATPTRGVSPAAREQLVAARAANQVPALGNLLVAVEEGAARGPRATDDLGSRSAKAIAGAFLTAAVLAGLTTTTEPAFARTQWLGMFVAFALAAWARSVGLGFVPGWVRLVERVPAWARIVVAAVVSRSIAGDLIEDALTANDTDFSSLLVPMLVSVGVAAALIPGPKPVEIARESA